MELFAIMATFSTLATFENSLTDAIMRPQNPRIHWAKRIFQKL
ncbi:Uncharacterized protein AC496_5309 [Pseudomonas savastanoi pv. glycinea]|uniref:Uncharacterized protein n=1 Tax=Pseudomonas savastanoi pv. glycinea TaxID=318 RepID=A0ABR5L2S2_PSESG|nr:Uncharacterized protein AC501_5452 [Pseudomonas amygdali pv. lachrymans]KPC20893.1 Uncharacterized protein AC498_1339 [Pseudomonas savastanoi pv. glycinea]KPC29064.1 Uncharacterized protein AC497_5220 [Pseudomonas savastanoi pv. glycinea]KPC38261.1 Uncharacterized protein AC496_5309 [Pseudomonas savastanoi pv. glycinea]KPC43232.1 Uncharacterized protein ABK00_2202 [Pseudomonas savastanoi pv. glycinea]